MSLKIHHGAPGSYKSSGAIQDDVIPALNEGRTIVSNIRGLTRERVFDAIENHPKIEKLLSDMPDNINIIYVDTDTKKGRERMARWFHWAPKDAYIFIDEIQRIYPKRWTSRNIAELDYPGGAEEAEKVERPPTLEDAFDMQRHHNWDLCFTTPHIKKVRDDLRQAAERAYKHKNKALLGGLPFLKGRYLEGDHTPDDNGTTTQLSSVIDKRINKHVFKLYDSTTTGKVSDTKAGQSIFKNPRLQVALGLFALSVGFGIYRYISGGGVLATNQESSDSDIQIETSTEVNATTKVVADPAAYLAANYVDDSEAGKSIDNTGSVEKTQSIENKALSPLSDRPIDIQGHIANEQTGEHLYSFAVQKDNTWYYTTTKSLEEMGYIIKPNGPCSAKLRFEDQERTVTCGNRSNDYFDSKAAVAATMSGGTQLGGAATAAQILDSKTSL
ncbi:MAG: zonular occludens toxin domain-containing protein [Candidatus Sedimenticola sp. 6PFRAG7]